MGLRPGRCYRKLHRAFTRQSNKKPRKGYIKGVPKPKISTFEMGAVRKKFSKVIYLTSTKAIQIRHNAIESARVSVNQHLEKSFGKEKAFFFKIRIYPHHVLRENALATGAGADRFQQGMRASFGKPVSTAARVKNGQKLMEIRVNEKNVPTAKLALKQANYKLPVPCRMIVEDVKPIKS